MTKTDIIKSHILKKEKGIKSVKKEIATLENTLKIIDAYYYAGIMDNESDTELEYLEKRMIQTYLDLIEQKKILYLSERDLKKLVNSLDLV